MGRTVSVPDCDATHQQALNGAPVEVCEDSGIYAKLAHSPHETKPS